MDYRSLSLDKLFVNEGHTKSADLPKGFVAYPSALLNGLTPEQLSRQQQIYQQVYAEARATTGVRKFMVEELPFETRN